MMVEDCVFVLQTGSRLYFHLSLYLSFFSLRRLLVLANRWTAFIVLLLLFALDHHDPDLNRRGPSLAH
jgi:hypothetical protein